MQRNILLITILFLTSIVYAQEYQNLEKLNDAAQTVYFSENAKERAIKISENVAKAAIFFQQEFNVRPNYTLLVLSPTDWKKYAHPNAIYGIPHYLPDGRLVVAAEDNEFWRRNTPLIEKLPAELAKKFKNVYADKNGHVLLADFFDLLAVHELGHAFQKAAGMITQRSWLSELLCNVLLHTFIAEKNPVLLSALTAFPQATVAAFPIDRLKYTELGDFDKYYNEIAQNHPDNYGWYQCRFHTVAGDIYDAGGVAAMKNLWNTLLMHKEKLNDDELRIVLNKAHPALAHAIVNWNR